MANENTERVSLRISNQQYDFWSAIEIRMGLDSQSGVSFVAPWEPARADMRALFRPFSFPSVALDVSGEPLFAGFVQDIVPSVNAAERQLDVVAYSKSALLEAVHAPTILLPLQSDGLGLFAIAERLCRPFDIGVVIEGDQGDVFDRVRPPRASKSRRVRLDRASLASADGARATLDGNIMEFLVELAAQRGFVISTTPKGELLFTRCVSPTTNTMVRLHAPGAMVYNPYPLLVRAVALHQDAGGVWAELSLVLPGSFGLPDPLGDIQYPTAFPWEA
jgi:hypothetical protein